MPWSRPSRGSTSDDRRAAGSLMAAMPDALVLTWEDLDALVARLAVLVGRDYDVVLAITRGGLVPAGMLAYRLDLREILVAGAELYLPDGGTHERPRIGHVPDAALLRGRRVLVVDEVWETGATMTEVARLVREAGGQPITAVLHHKPARSTVAGAAPDHAAATVDGWVTYPYKAGG
jgi:uncharacterized protein